MVYRSVAGEKEISWSTVPLKAVVLCRLILENNHRIGSKSGKGTFLEAIKDTISTPLEAISGGIVHIGDSFDIKDGHSRSSGRISRDVDCLGR